MNLLTLGYGDCVAVDNISDHEIMFNNYKEKITHQLQHYSELYQNFIDVNILFYNIYTLFTQLH